MDSRTFVPPSGDPNARIVFVGEQPGRLEVERRQPFIGPAGKNLDECLIAASLHRNECYFTNVIKDFDHGPDHYMEITKNGKVHIHPQGEHYITLLRDELNSIHSNVIVACGNRALYALTSRIGITHWRGSILSSTLLPGRKVIPTLHPATWTQEKLYENPEAYLNKYLVIEDLKKVQREALYPDIRFVSRERRIAPTMAECLAFLHTCVEKGSTQGSTITYDIETVPHTQEIACIGFAYAPTASICIPFVGPHGSYFTVEQEVQLMVRIAELLENPAITKLGQYVIFDAHLLFRKYGIVSRNLEDTMIAQKILYPEFPVGLDMITSLYTDFPYYKKDGKVWITGDGTFEQGWNYNCNDTLTCEIAFPQQRQALRQKGNLEAYERQVRLIEPLTFMMEHGIKVDVAGMQVRKEANEKKIEALTCHVYETMGTKINLNSPQQLMDYFYAHKRIAPYLKNGKPTVDINAMKRLATTHALPEAAMILEIRHLVKQNTTFLNPLKVDADNRIRCAYNPVGTKFSRISSSENIFGTGMNLQNVPMEVREFLIADEGYVIYGLDYAQFENRIVAYVGRIQQMIMAFEQGLDTHRLTAALVSSKMGLPRHYDEVTEEERQNLGKRPNHAFNYGFGPQSFALMHEIDLAAAKSVYRAYHEAYPGLKGGYWKGIEEQLRADRTLTNLYGRKTTFFGHWDHKLLNTAYSCIPQGTCGDCINDRAINFTYYSTDCKPVELLTQIHDSMDIQIPLSIPLEQHALILLRIKASMEAPLVAHGRQFIPPVDLVIGKNLNKKKGVELKGKDFSEDVDILAEAIRAALHELSLPDWFRGTQ
jgi:uracil-DNA glycosylase family 4